MRYVAIYVASVCMRVCVILWLSVLGWQTKSISSLNTHLSANTPAAAEPVTMPAK